MGADYDQTMHTFSVCRELPYRNHTHTVQLNFLKDMHLGHTPPPEPGIFIRQLHVPNNIEHNNKDLDREVIGLDSGEQNNTMKFWSKLLVNMPQTWPTTC